MNFPVATRRQLIRNCVLIPLIVLEARAAGGEPSAPSQDFLPGIHRILFLGDSITYGGNYVDAIETQLLLRYPDRGFQVINCGLSSETVSGLSEEGHADGKFPRPDLHERLDRVLARVKPDLVFACYGMNDGIYLPLDDERFERFKSGMNRLHEKVIASGAKIIHVTPPVFDPIPIRRKVADAPHADAAHPYEGYNEVLDAYADWLLSRHAVGWQVVDVHGPMKQAIAERRKQESAFTFSRDGVHPDAAGHWVMAKAILKGLAAPFDPEDQAFGDRKDPSSRVARAEKIVRERGRIMIDAWLTDTGHKRPMKPGLPLREAEARVAESDNKLRDLAKAGADAPN